MAQTNLSAYLPCRMPKPRAATPRQPRATMPHPVARTRILTIDMGRFTVRRARLFCVLIARAGTASSRLDELGKPPSLPGICQFKERHGPASFFTGSTAPLMVRQKR